MKLSIITINYNNAEGLRKTLASVASQTYADIEHIIVDGGSTDGSVEIIEAYASDVVRSTNSCVPTGGDGCHAAVEGLDYTPAEGAQPLAQQDATSPKATQPHRVIWISEPDKGIYNAMNKGIKMANGEYLLFLNSGDYLVDVDTLKNVFEDANDVDIIYGDRINVWKDGLERNRDSFPDHITGYFLYRGMISHQASFIKSDLFVKYGLYREDLKYGADWEFFLRTFLLYNCTYQHIYQNVVYFDCLGISSVAENNKEMWEERKRVFAETLPAFAEDYMLMEHYQEVLRGYDKRANQLGKMIVKPIRRLLKLLKK